MWAAGESRGAAPRGPAGPAPPERLLPHVQSLLCFFTFLVQFTLCFFLTAEFVISLAEKNTTFDTFKAILLKNGAEFTVSDA